MQARDTWPRFGQHDTPREYAADLVSKVFKGQSGAAEHFDVHRSTISKLLKPDYTEVERHRKPLPLGFLASLMLLFVEKKLGKAAGADEIEAAQEFFLEQMNKLLRNYHASYEHHPLFETWDELRAEAASYRPGRKVPPQPPIPPQSERPTEPPPMPDPYMVPTLPPQGVFGREETLVEIEELLAGGTSGTPDLSPVALRGFGGIGKTTLASAIGSRPNVAELYPDGVFWVEIGLKPSIRQLLTTWGDALGIDLRAEWDEDACKVRLRNVISRRRALLIIDDVWDANHARYFLVGGPRCRTLFTTREWEVVRALTTPDRVCNVGLLTQDASLQMLTRLAPEAVAAEPQVAQKLCAKLDGLPLGIKLAGQLLALEGGVPSRARKLLEELVERREARLRLLEREGRLGLPGVEPPSLQAIMGMSVERLDQTDRARFAMLAVFGGEPLTWEIGATAAVWVCSVDEAEATTSRLIQHGLVERRQDDRYWMHALLADYAQELLEKTYPAARKVMS